MTTKNASAMVLWSSSVELLAGDLRFFALALLTLGVDAR
jgi:hypothetical protein